ncbi:Pimeloyl-ACP methyl ester carboxylesterase [Rhodospirillales bacterium URHD0017]|nr:Pimeloyl-ACP methyl ester carboxylesterase [Rhodospirillales bacterium URHD0017]
MQCETDKATIDYEVHGDGQPILLLHGWTMDRRVEIFDYEKIMATRPGWRRIYPDLPGMGRSVAKAGFANQDDVLDALLAFIDQVLPAGRFALAGTSLGAYLARAIAARRRSRIAGLLLRVPCIFAEDARRDLPPFQALVTDPDGRADLDGLLIQTPAYAQALKHKDDAVVQPAIQATAPIASEIRADPKRYGFSFDLIEAEKTFDEPTLIIAGRRDTTVGYRDAWSILDSYPRATFVALDRADHGWPMETPNLLPALVDDWLERIARAERGA